MKEQISALMDSELDDPEADQCVRRLGNDPQMRETWAVYHLVGDTLRGHTAGALPATFDERLAREPVVLAPRPRRHRPAWVALSAAASVAAVAYVGWTAMPFLSPQTQSPQIAVAAPAPASPLAVVAEPIRPSAIVPVADDMSDYLMAHQRFAASSAMVGVAPYARAVSEEIETR